jgi:hypothetical protein
MPDEKEKIERRMDESVRLYGQIPREDPRRDDIFEELSELCARLDRLLNPRRLLH